MRAVDTNIIVRYLTRDDPRQAPRAKAVIDAGDIHASAAYHAHHVNVMARRAVAACA